MEEGECVLDSLFNDVDMEDVDEGELIKEDDGETVVANGSIPSCDTKIGSSGNDCQQSHDKGPAKNKTRRKRKKKSGRRGVVEPKVPDIHRFVADACKKLKEKKSYMVYNAVACLGVSTLSNILKEVDAVQSCGGQMTADGRRFRSGGGVLWHILKTKEPSAYKEIMLKTKEFEKQFKQQNKKLVVCKGSEMGDEEDKSLVASLPVGDMCDEHGVEAQDGQPRAKHSSVHDRLRMPVTYDDIL